MERRHANASNGICCEPIWHSHPRHLLVSGVTSNPATLMNRPLDWAILFQYFESNRVRPGARTVQRPVEGEGPSGTVLIHDGQDFAVDDTFARPASSNLNPNQRMPVPWNVYSAVALTIRTGFRRWAKDYKDRPPELDAAVAARPGRSRPVTKVFVGLE